MIFIEKKYLYAIIAASVGTAAFLVVSIPLRDPSMMTSQFLIPIDSRINNVLVASMIVALTPPAIAYYLNSRYRNTVADNVPSFLRSVVDDVNAGIPLPRALENAADQDFGPISTELKRAISRFLMGQTLEESLEEMGRKLRHPQGEQATTILAEAYTSGGKTRDVLNTAVDIYATFEEYREMRKTQVRPYSMLIDMAVLIFLVIAYMVLFQFLAPFQESASQGGPLLQGLLPLTYYNTIFLWASVIESVFGGIIGGKITSGSVKGGLLHAAILVGITLAFFNLLIFEQVIVLI